jgi:hypothetical protein
MIRALNSETDPEALLESILDMALQAVKGERGMILLSEGKETSSPFGGAEPGDRKRCRTPRRSAVASWPSR